MCFYEYSLAEGPGWSVMLMADPVDKESSEGLSSRCPDKERAAPVCLAPKRSVSGIDELLRRDAARRDLRDLARQLQRFLDGML